MTNKYKFNEFSITTIIMIRFLIVEVSAIWGFNERF